MRLEFPFLGWPLILKEEEGESENRREEVLIKRLLMRKRVMSPILQVTLHIIDIETGCELNIP